MIVIPRRSASLRAIRTLATRPFVRFLAIGGLSFIVDLAILRVLYYADVPLTVATTVGWLVGFIVTFSLNRFFVFTATTSLATSGLRYVVLALGNFVATIGLVTGLVHLGLAVELAKTLTVALLAIANFFAYRSWVFRHATPEPLPPSEAS